MPSLLSLPRELRDQIIDYVVHGLRPAPEKPNRNEDPTEAGRVRFEDMGWRNMSKERKRIPASHSLSEDEYHGFEGNPMLFESSTYAFEPVFTGLLRTCHQLRKETLERQATVQLPYVLDLLIVNLLDVWVTWLSIPLQNSTIIDRLEVNVRLSSKSGGARVGHGRALDSDHFSRLAQRLFTRILSRGASGPIPAEEMKDAVISADYRTSKGIIEEIAYKPNYCIQQLDISFGDRSIDDTYEMVASPARDMHQGALLTEADMFFAEDLHRYYLILKRDLRSFLWTNNKSASYPLHKRALQERVGGLTISCAGNIPEDDDKFLISDEYDRAAATMSGPWRTAMRSMVIKRKRNGIHEKGRAQTDESVQG